MHSIQNHFPFEVSPSDNGRVLLSMEIEAIYVQTFISMLDSLAGMFRIVNSKAKVALAYHKLPENLENNARFFEQFASSVVETFKIHRKHFDIPTRELVSLTLKDIKEQYPNACYDSVKQILSKAKLLKGTDFYRN